MSKARNYVSHHLVKTLHAKTEFYLCANEHDQLIDAREKGSTSNLIDIYADKPDLEKSFEKLQPNNN